jgi:glutamate/tyrosine decarboxylase-like PLP-dependent enzyme
MNWDLTIPSMLGYFSAMLYNPNNVAFEGSTATTLLELLVGDDICRMLGYTIAKGGDRVRPWGHVTCDGSVANIEAIWSARNLKLYPLAVKAALLDERNAALASARELMVLLPAGSKAKLIELDTWQLLNLDADVVLAIPARLSGQFGIEPKLVTERISRWSVQTLGLAAFAGRFLGDIGPLRVFVPGSKHYSFPKAVALLGLGADSLQNIPVDLDARLDVAELRICLDQCLAARQPIIAVVAVIGTTEESAVDPLADILALRAEFAQRGLVFHVHADAAFGGYHRSLLNGPFDLPEAVAVQAPPLVAPLSAHTARQLHALGGADSITVDPHKSGFIPYLPGRCATATRQCAIW